MATAKRRSSARKSTTSSRKGRSGSRAGGSRRRGTAKSATANAKRTARGQFKEKGRSLNVDRPMKAKTKTKSGHEDRGDRAA